MSSPNCPWIAVLLKGDEPVTKLGAIIPVGRLMVHQPELFSSNSALVLYYKLCLGATFLVNVPNPSPAFFTFDTF